MKNTSFIIFLFALAAPAYASSETASARVYHVPPAEAEASEDITIRADVDRAWTSTLELHYRGLGEAVFRRTPFERGSGSQYLASVPGSVVAPPGLEYFITSTNGALTAGHFASAERPHRVMVHRDGRDASRDREIARYGGHRAQFRFSGELVDFGRRTINDPSTMESHEVDDRYYRVDAEFTYRVMSFPLRAIRVGYTRLIGITPATDRGDGVCGEVLEGLAPCERSAGFSAGAWLETRLRITELVGLDTRLLFQAAPDGVGLGGRGELRFGDDLGSHIAVGAERMQEVGSSFFFRLGWATVPRFPMSATIELSDYPSEHRDTGVRLFYEVSRELGDGLRLGGRVGYQARDEGIGGVSGGLSASFDFFDF